MSKINKGKVVQGGILAGLVMAVGEYLFSQPVMGDEWAQVLETRQVPAIGPAEVGWFVVCLLVLGIATVWLYAAIRPRYGAGVRTAICAGLWVWFFVWFYGYVVGLIMGLFSVKLVGVAILWGLVEVPLAAVCGAMLYSEQSEEQAGTAGPERAPRQ